MKTLFTNSKLIILAILLFLGSCSSPQVANTGAPQEKTALATPLFMEGLWVPEPEFKALSTGRIGNGFRYGFPELLVVQTTSGSDGHQYLHGGAYWGDESPELHPCEDAWCRESGLRLAFSVESGDTSAILHDVQGVANRFNHIDRESSASTGSTISEQADRTGFRYSESDWAYRHLYFAGEYRVGFVDGGAGREISLDENGSVTGDPTWSKYFLLTQHSHPVFVLEDRNRKREYLAFFPDEKAAFSFELNGVLNTEDLEDGEGAAILTGPMLMTFSRK